MEPGVPGNARQGLSITSLSLCGGDNAIVSCNRLPALVLRLRVNVRSRAGCLCFT